MNSNIFETDPNSMQGSGYTGAYVPPGGEPVAGLPTEDDSVKPNRSLFRRVFSWENRYALSAALSCLVMVGVFVFKRGGDKAPSLEVANQSDLDDKKADDQAKDDPKKQAKVEDTHAKPISNDENPSEPVAKAEEQSPAPKAIETNQRGSTADLAKVESPVSPPPADAENKKNEVDNAEGKKAEPAGKTVAEAMPSESGSNQPTTAKPTTPDTKTEPAGNPSTTVAESSLAQAPTRKNEPLEARPEAKKNDATFISNANSPTNPGPATDSPPKSDPPTTTAQPPVNSPGSSPEPPAAVTHVAIASSTQATTRSSPPPDPMPAPEAAATSRSLPSSIAPEATKTTFAADPVPDADPLAATGEWVEIPNKSKRKSNPSPPVSRAVASESKTVVAPSPADGSASSSNDLEPLEPVVHIVQRGENFYSIAQRYYSSGRFYKALWSANRDQVEAPDKLYVGTVIRVPPPEALDRSLIEPPAGMRTSSTNANMNNSIEPSDRSISNVRSTSNAAGSYAKPQRLISVSRRPRQETSFEDVPLERPRPRYQVHKYETLRSIARDLLSDSHRADEILDLNRDVIDDPTDLTPGTVLVLPDDARIHGRAVR